MLDFDGTLSEIAPTPDAAVILPANRDALLSLVAHYPLVAVVSGRAVRDVAARVDVDDVVYAGNHGAEYMIAGDVSLSSNTLANRTMVADVLDHVRRAVEIPGLKFEDKTFSASVHFRSTRNPETADAALRAALTNAPNVNRIETFWGKMVLELRPANGPDKGDAVAALAANCSLDSILFVGDDTTDVDAMVRLKKLSGVAGISVAVMSEETPPALADAADYSLNGVAEVAQLLRMLGSFRTTLR